MESSIDEAISTLDSCKKWRRQIAGVYRPILHRHKHDIAALCFFRIYLAWEEFLEEAFVVLFVKAKKGTQGARSLLDVKTRKEAYRILKGERRSFVERSTTKEIRERATTFFKDGKPFDVPLAAGATHLERMRRIRNRIAHRSKSAEEQFKDLIRDLFGAYRAESPGSLLLLPPPSNFGLPPGVKSGPTIINAYTDILRVMADEIAK